MLDLDALLKKASEAKPPKRSQRLGSPWVKLYAAYRKLVEQGFDTPKAMDWLIGEGAVNKADREKGIKAFQQLNYRRGISKSH